MIKIAKITDSSIKEWNEALEACPHATFFHSYEWAEIWHQYISLVPRAQKIEFSDGKTLILPCSYIPSKKGLLKHVVMSPATTFGGALYNEEITEDHLNLVFNEIRSFSSVTWRQNPYETVLRAVWKSKLQKDVTQVIDLRGGFGAVHQEWARGKGSMLRKIRKARAAGITVRTAGSREDWIEYYKAYKDSLTRWGDSATNRHNWELFRILYERRSKQIKLWVAELNREFTSGAICFYQNKHVVYWHGAAYARYFDMRPVNLLHAEIIKDACESGYNWYDFNPSGGHRGVANFKKSFGAKAYKSNVLTYRSAPVKLLQLLRRFLP